MRSNTETLHLLFPAQTGTVHSYEELLRANPLPPELKRSVLEELLGPGAYTDQVIAQYGLAGVAGRPLSMHEKVTIDALQGRGSDVGNRTLLGALHHTRGDDLMAWADLAAMATQMRVEALAC